MNEKMQSGSRRALIGLVGAMLVLGALPTVVLGAGQPSCGDVLTTNTKLTANLDCSGYPGTALTMGANGITLNLNGKTITGPAGGGNFYGVNTNGYHRTTVKNGAFNDFYIGVYVNSSNRTLVQNVQILGQPLDDYGVYVYAGVRNTLNKLKVVGVKNAVYAEYTAKLKVTNSMLVGDGSSGKGTWLNRTSAATLSNNQVAAAIGMYEMQSHRSTYSGNAATAGIYGFYFECQGYGELTVTGNTSNDASSAGFSLHECYAIEHPVAGYTGTRVIGNTSTGASYGFATYDSYNELWRANVATDNENDGFWLEGPSGGRFIANTALRNDGNGFSLVENEGYANVDAFSFNTARQNDSYGFRADYFAPGDDNVATNNGTNCWRVDC